MFLPPFIYRRSLSPIAATLPPSIASPTTLQWRNADLDYGSLQKLIESLEALPDDPSLVKARESDDLLALKTLSQSELVLKRVTNPVAVKLLWKVCSIPDFRSIGHGEYTSLLETIFLNLYDLGRISDDWLQKQVSSLENIHGNIDTLSKRLAGGLRPN